MEIHSELTPDRIRKFNKIDFDWDMESRSIEPPQNSGEVKESLSGKRVVDWEKRYETLCEYVKEHGTSHDSSITHDKSMYDWIVHQRCFYRHIYGESATETEKTKPRGNPSPERIQKLNNEINVDWKFESKSPYMVVLSLMIDAWKTSNKKWMEKYMLLKQFHARTWAF